MRARHKLNAANFYISLGLAALAGGFAESFNIFLLALTLLVFWQVLKGDIR
jgi:hypothetical protein